MSWQQLIDEVQAILAEESCPRYFDLRTGTPRGRKKKGKGSCKPKSFMPGVVRSFRPSMGKPGTTTANIGTPPAPPGSGGGMDGGAGAGAGGGAGGAGGGGL